MIGGQHLIVGLPGPDLDADSAAILARVRPAGVILFRRNVVDAARLTALVADLRSIDPQVLVFVDAEGGRVDRFAPVVGPAPGADQVARAGERAALRMGRWIGRSLAAFDCDVDLAPVVDLDCGEVDNALARRTWGSEPEQVVALGSAFLGGLFEAGIGGCVKHFPGLGAARHDTHHAGTVIELDAAGLERHLEPFRLLGEAAGAVMVSHATYPALDTSGLPATVSRAIATGWLRERLGFSGVSISDDLEMAALAPVGDLPARAAAALAAGCDLVALCATLSQAEATASALELVPGELRGPAVERIARWRSDLAQLRARRLRGRRQGGAGELGRVRQGLARLGRAVAE